jgi:ketosteroid isomerase-like protein
LNGRIASGGTAAAYKANLSAEARLHRFGVMSIVGRAEIANWLGQHAGSLTAITGAADASEAGDLGYSYGTYELKGAAPESGAYIRVWTRDGAGKWLVVADVTQPASPGG